jgi:hypothetical protein
MESTDESLGLEQSSVRSLQRQQSSLLQDSVLRSVVGGISNLFGRGAKARVHADAVPCGSNIKGTT